MTDDEVTACLAVLARLDDDALPASVRLRLERAVTSAARGIKRRAKVRRSTESRAADRALLASATRFHTELPSTELPAVEPPPTGSGGDAALGTLRRERHCYVCKRAYREVDADYHQMCASCADQNRTHRVARTRLDGRVAVLTGGRVKIGFHTALKMLRDGARVLVTTRFPRDAARRFAEVDDVGEWGDRLEIHRLDLMELDALVGFVGDVGRRFGHLDILINNAAQTLYRPPAYHREVRAAESEPLAGTAARLAVASGSASPPVPRGPLTEFSPATETFPAALTDEIFPAAMTDETGQPLDLRAVNSWMLRDGDVSPHEWLQVHVVNAFAPFLLSSRLRPLMAASPHPHRHRHVVQVSAMEGSFSRRNKTVRHPHTNMAKASLNMLVRTAAADYAADGILMNAVDTGWVTDERPHPGKQAERATGFRPPLDVIDGAARVYHPIVAAERGERMSGLFLKDYRSVPW